MQFFSAFNILFIVVVFYLQFCFHSQFHCSSHQETFYAVVVAFAFRCVAIIFILNCQFYAVDFMLLVSCDCTTSLLMSSYCCCWFLFSWMMIIIIVVVGFYLFFCKVSHPHKNEHKIQRVIEEQQQLVVFKQNKKKKKTTKKILEKKLNT